MANLRSINYLNYGSNLKSENDNPNEAQNQGSVSIHNIFWPNEIYPDLKEMTIKFHNVLIISHHYTGWYCFLHCTLFITEEYYVTIKL